MSQDDAALVRRLQQGEHDALARLFDGYARAVHGMAVRILRDPAEAEEVVQEVYVQAWRQAERFDPARGSVAAWLLTMARTRALDRLRRRAVRKEAAEAVPAAPAAPAPEEPMAVRAALGALSRAQRQALELAFFEGHTHVEIAALLGEPLGTVKSRIRAAMLRLRDALS